MRILVFSGIEKKTIVKLVKKAIIARIETEYLRSNFIIFTDKKVISIENSIIRKNKSLLFLGKKYKKSITPDIFLIKYIFFIYA